MSSTFRLRAPGCRLRGRAVFRTAFFFPFTLLFAALFGLAFFLADFRLAAGLFLASRLGTFFLCVTFLAFVCFLLRVFRFAIIAVYPPGHHFRRFYELVAAVGLEPTTYGL
ncbi:MAG: hypothetical protein ACRD23_14145 [Terriglobales bacterium]